MPTPSRVASPRASRSSPASQVSLAWVPMRAVMRPWARPCQLFREGDAVGEARLALAGHPRVVAAVKLLQVHVEHLVGDRRAQAARLDRGRERVGRVPDVVDGGDAGADHVGAAEQGELVPLVVADVLFHAEGDGVERLAADAVVALAAEHQRCRVAVAVDEARQHCFAGAAERLGRRPAAARTRGAGMEDAAVLDRDLAAGDHRQAFGHRVEKIRRDQQVDRLGRGGHRAIVPARRPARKSANEKARGSLPGARRDLACSSCCCAGRAGSAASGTG
jgi:hypothetical protein